MTSDPHVVGSITLKALLEDPNLKNPSSIGSSGSQCKIKKDVSDQPQFNYGSAFLGPNLWDRSLDSTDFNVEYMDLDEFLSENGIQTGIDDVLKDFPVGLEKTEDSSCGINVTNTLLASPCLFLQSPHQYLKSSPSSPAQYNTPVTQLNSENPSPSSSPCHVNFKVSEHDLALTSVPGEDGFDPRMRNFTEEELKPQPVIKKSKKIFVPEEMKDEKYWARRHKNNFAARRSRDARRVKENQIAMRAAFLEKENSCLREEMIRLQKENAKLKATVAQYEGRSQTYINLLSK